MAAPTSNTARILLAPIPLYRRILRVHRQLPAAMRAFGDDYVKSEFRRHKESDNPVHIVGFITQWQDYLDLLTDQTKPENGDATTQFTNIPTNGLGKRLQEGHIEKMSDEQLGQLYELRTQLRDTLTDDAKSKK
ncbi:hypothetical protein BC940DRAFT_230542 [Gongronella butleri]|nr:hypothetical protein BC940DRAFT_230542 [Gongronella butleri]